MRMVSMKREDPTYIWMRIVFALLAPWVTIGPGFGFGALEWTAPWAWLMFGPCIAMTLAALAVNLPWVFERIRSEVTFQSEAWEKVIGRSENKEDHGA